MAKGCSYEQLVASFSPTIENAGKMPALRGLEDSDRYGIETGHRVESGGRWGPFLIRRAPRCGRAGVCWSSRNEALFGSIGEGSTCGDATCGEGAGEGEAVEVGGARTCGAVGEYFGARDVSGDRSKDGDWDGGRSCVEDAAGDYGGAGDGVEMHGACGEGVAGE